MNSQLKDAILENNIQLAKELINAGTDLNIQDKDGDTLLHFASRHKCLEIVKELINAGADLLSKKNNIEFVFPDPGELVRSKFIILFFSISNN